MKKICIYCGSSLGKSPNYREHAKQLATSLAQRKITLVYGGASIGLMGDIADTVLEHGGEVIGVIPQSLVERELAHKALSQLIIVDSMHARKAKMAELSDAFIAMPGGLGTLEELFEILTWQQLDLHHKPCGLLNIDNYYAQLIVFLKHIVDQGFAKQHDIERLLVHQQSNALLDALLTTTK